MNIESAQYVKDKDGNNDIIKITLDKVVMDVPLDPANRHYAAILEWVAEGNTIEEAD